jgi:hypothetical protein
MLLHKIGKTPFVDVNGEHLVINQAAAEARRRVSM